MQQEWSHRQQIGDSSIRSGTRQSKGLVFGQSNSDDIILSASKPLDCVVKVVERQNHEVVFQIKS